MKSHTCTARIPCSALGQFKITVIVNGIIGAANFLGGTFKINSVDSVSRHESELSFEEVTRTGNQISALRVLIDKADAEKINSLFGYAPAANLNLFKD